MKELSSVLTKITSFNPSLGVIAMVPNSLGPGELLLHYGTEQQKDKYLPLMASGKTVGSFALTEPNAGSDALSLETTAKKDGEEYIINGTKKYITNAPYADVFLVMAKTNPDIEGSEGISSFLIDSNSNGIQIGETPKMLGQKGSASPEVYFQDCRINKDAFSHFHIPLRYTNLNIFRARPMILIKPISYLINRFSDGIDRAKLFFIRFCTDWHWISMKTYKI